MARIAGDPGLGDRRQIGKQGRAARTRDRDAPYAPGFGVRADRRDVVEHELHFTGDQVVDRLRTAAVGHVQDERPGHRLEELASQVPGGAVAARGHHQLAGVFLRVVDQLPDRVHRKPVVHGEEIEHAHAVGDEGEVFVDVVGYFREQRAVDRERHDVAVAERVAVGRGFHDVHGADGE